MNITYYCDVLDFQNVFLIKQVHPAHQIKVIYVKVHDKLYRKAKKYISDIKSRNPSLNQATKTKTTILFSRKSKSKTKL
jgi:predicted glycosyltransferase involved in capsule biosynthesis